MFFEIYTHNNLIVRGRKLLAPLEFDHELNLAPSVTMELDGDWIPLIDGREEVKIYLDSGKVFWGIIWGFPHDKAEETITLDVRHVVTEWQYRQISVNHAMSNKNLNIVYKGDKVKKSKDNDETITASSFTILGKKLNKMTDADWIAKAGATAWVTSNGDRVKITNVDHSDVKKKEGTYDVIFSTKKGTSVKVECNVVEAIDYQTPRTKSSKRNRETIKATPFSVYVDEGLTADEVKEKVKAEAYVYRHKNQKVAVTSITTNFRNEVGKYTVTASTANGTTITVKVEVKAGDEYDNVSDPSVVDKLEDIYTDLNFAYEGWQIDFKDDAGEEMIDYVYSKQNKLEALTQTVELTDDLWWRVGFWNERRLEIGRFGEIKPYTLSTRPSGRSNIRIITEPQIEPDIENVANVATVYSDKGDGGMTSLTLRDVYMDKELVKRGVIENEIQKDGFPVVILRANVNNERDYSRFVSQYPKLAPNNELEYSVIDEESIALEHGKLIETAFAFNDLSPFETDGEYITDKQRIRAAKVAYRTAIRKLKQMRRSYNITMTTEELPYDLLAGDKVRLQYDNKLFKLEACSKYYKKLMEMDDFYYITRIHFTVDQYGKEICEITLAKWLKIERETQP